VNPWIHDFAAYNLWSRPAGLLAALHMLRAGGAQVALMDCLERTWSDVPWPRPQATGRGHYPKTVLPTPVVLRGVPRRYGRYGLDPGAVRGALEHLSPPPDLILITTIMTYWYPGAAEAIAMVGSLWPGVPVALGGIYASLCPEHARGLGADLVLRGRLEDPANWASLWGLMGLTAPSLPAGAGFELAQDLYAEPDFSIILGSRGCPFHCPYCASRSLHPAFLQADPGRLLPAIEREYARGVRDFAFYDDALLVRPDTWLWPLLDWFEGKEARLHTPNAMHARYLTPEVCGRLKRAGVQTVRLGLETEDFEHRLDTKLSREQWEAGIAALCEAGFGHGQVGAYILFGLPDQDMTGVTRTIAMARSCGVRPELAYFTPIPASPLFKRACEVSPYPLQSEPLCQNNSIWPCVEGGYSWEQARYWHDLLGYP
jgi:radical SAM superfamily enzyme YgiQ (UPF0313 family)